MSIVTDVISKDDGRPSLSGLNERLAMFLTHLPHAVSLCELFLPSASEFGAVRYLHTLEYTVVVSPCNSVFSCISDFSPNCLHYM